MKNTAIAMQEKCPHCKQFFQLNAATKWLVERAVQNKLKDISITCTACNKQVKLLLGQPPAELPDKKEQFIRPAAVSWQGQRKYRVTVAAAVNFLSGTIAQNENELLWELSCSAAAPDQLLLHQLSKKSIMQDSQMKAFNAILDIANEPAATLHFRINAEGGLTALLNGGAIEKQWNGIKFDKLQEHRLTNPWLDEVIMGFDEEYRDFFKTVQRNPLYYLFFLPAGKMERNNVSPRPLGVGWQRLSQLFAPHFMELVPRYTAEEEEGAVKVHIQAEAETRQLLPEFEKLFGEKYAVPTQLPLDYSFYLEGQYRFLDNGLLQAGKILIKEQANDHFFTTNQYTFNLLNE